MTTDIFFNPVWDIRMTDTSLRDGSHHKRHQFTKDEVQAIVSALDAAGVPVIEVTHGDGLGGSSFNYGFSKTPEQELIKLAAETAKDAKIAFLMLPAFTVVVTYISFFSLSPGLLVSMRACKVRVVGSREAAT